MSPLFDDYCTLLALFCKQCEEDLDINFNLSYSTIIHKLKLNRGAA